MRQVQICTLFFLRFGSKLREIEYKYKNERHKKSQKDLSQTEGRSQAATLAACGGPEEPGWPVWVKEGSWEVSETTPCCVSVCVCVLALGDGPIHCKIGIFFLISIFPYKETGSLRSK